MVTKEEKNSFQWTSNRTGSMSVRGGSGSLIIHTSACKMVTRKKNLLHSNSSSNPYFDDNIFVQSAIWNMLSWFKTFFKFLCFSVLRAESIIELILTAVTSWSPLLYHVHFKEIHYYICVFVSRWCSSLSSSSHPTAFLNLQVRQTL